MTTSPATVTREAGTSQPARHKSRRHLSATHLLIGVAVLLAFSLNFLALQDRDEMTAVAAAREPLAAGSVLSPTDLDFVPIEADFVGLSQLLEEGAAGAYEGWVLQRSVGAGELITPSILIEPGAPSGLRSMSVPVPVEHAAGGTLSRGDRVDVISVEDGTAFFVVVDVEILQVMGTDRGGLGGLADYHIVVAVDADQALALAVAIDAGSIEVIRSTGAVHHEKGQGSDDS